jgi:hypothetical protein
VTHILTVDPGLMTGIALGFYDATTPYQLISRWQVGRGIHGWVEWKHSVGLDLPVDELLYEKFIFSPDEVGDFSGVPIEGSIEEWGILERIPVIVQDRSHKGRLIGYPTEAVTKVQRQRVRFDWLEEHGLFEAGTGNDDSNDAITHGLVSLKIRNHVPTMRRYWPPRRRLQAVA